MNDQGMAGWSVDLLANAKVRIEAFGLDLARFPEEARRAAETTHAALMSGNGVRGATHLAILLFIGIAVEWLYWTYAYSPLRAVLAAPAPSPLQALRPGLRRLVLQGSGLLLFTAAAVGASAAFNWPPTVQKLVIAATLLLLALRLAWTAVSIVIAPGRPQLRLVPVGRGKPARGARHRARLRRASALKRIEAALKKLKLQFADGRLTMLLPATPAQGSA